MESQKPTAKISKEQYEADLDNLQREIAKIRGETDAKILSASVEFANKHNPVKVGDIIRYPSGFMKVDEIKVVNNYPRATMVQPMCLYTGVRYTQQMKPFKNGERGVCGQFNVVEIIRE